MLKASDGFFVAYSSQLIAYLVYNPKHNITEETMNFEFHENSFPNAVNGLEWLLDLDALTNSMNSDSLQFSAGYNSGDISDKDVILAFPSRYLDLSNPDVHSDFDEFLPPPTNPSTQPPNVQRSNPT